jgi:glycine/D-amino acid oxidase-like deaminating enzyme
MFDVLTRSGVKNEKLSAAGVRQRWPQMSFADVSCAMFEPESGVLMARRAVQEVVRNTVSKGTEYLSATALPPQAKGTLNEIQIANGDSVSAGHFIFACGPWLPKVFPGIVGDRIFPTRQEVFFLGTPASDDSFRSPKMPAWLHHTHPDRPYALPNIEERGFKIAFDRHGPEFDPDSSDRVVGQPSIERLRAYLKQHVPALQNAPVIETRICQYENTWNGDFLIDRHPEAENVWLVGGGSGHGFKHGPAVGEYVAARLLHKAPAEPRFSLDSKQSDRKRAVY